jgi:YD repeat-containing protein
MKVSPSGPAGRVQAQVNPLGFATTFIWDAAGRRIGLQNPLGFINTSVFDSAGRLVSSVNPLNYATTDDNLVFRLEYD